MKKILLVGEPLGLLIANEYGELDTVSSFTKKVAGAELNVCVGLTRLGYFTEYFTKIGIDPFGKHIIRFLEKEGIGTKYLKIDETIATGFQMKGKTKAGDPKTFYFRKHSAASTITKEDIAQINLDEFDLIHITGIPLTISKSFREAIYYLALKGKKEGKFITFDPNLRPQMWEDKEEMKKTVNEIASMSDLFMPGISECLELLGLEKANVDEIFEKYSSMGVKRLIIKDGEKGSYYFDANNKVFESGFTVDCVIDTVGAGDGFAVGIISSFLENLNKNKMLERGNAIGAIQVTNISDNEGLPTRNELESFISKTKKR